MRNSLQEVRTMIDSLVVRVEVLIGSFWKLSFRQDLGFIPSGNVVLSSTYVGKILGADQLLVILCYRYQESGFGYWILSMTISGSGARGVERFVELQGVGLVSECGAKRKLSRCGRNQMGNEPTLALPKGADDFIVYYDARSKDLETCLEKGREGDCWLTNRWLSMKKVIASCDSKYLAYLEVEVEYQGSSGLLLQPELPEYKWERITKDIVVKLPSVIILWAVTGDVELNGSNVGTRNQQGLGVMEGSLERCSTFGKKDKLEPSYVGTFEIFGYIGPTFLFDELRVLMPRVVKSRDEIFSRWGYCDNHDLSRLDNQSIERDRLIGIGFVLNFVKFISFTFGDKEMISVIEAIIHEVFVKLLLKSSGKLSISERDRLIAVDRGTRSVPLFVMLSMTVSTWFGVFAMFYLSQ
ncbi:hypothetical protein Tco_0593366 [Tanacetum coccineum]